MLVRRRTNGIGVAAGCLFAVVASSPGLAQDAVTTLAEGRLSVCLYAGFPPVASQDADGDWQGWDVDFLRDFATTLNLELQPMAIVEFDGIWRLPGQDECDIAASGITITDARQQDSPGTVWSDPYHVTFRAYVVRTGDQGLVQSTNDFSGRTVIVTEGSTADLDLQRRIAIDQVPDVTIEYTDNDGEAAERVLNREAFAYASGQVTTDYMVSIYPGLATAWPHPYMQADGSTEREAFAFVVRAADDGLVEAVNAYIVANGEHYGQDGR